MDETTLATVALMAPMWAIGAAWLSYRIRVHLAVRQEINEQRAIDTLAADQALEEMTHEVIDRIDAELEAEYRKRFPIDPLRIR